MKDISATGTAVADSTAQMTLVYSLGDSLYLNITNRCSCSCVFCIRAEHRGVGSGESLWLAREPVAAEVIDQINGEDLARYREVVLCGYGEPTEALDTMLEVCRHLKTVAPDLPVRLNTNGLSDLINDQPTAHLLRGLVDKVSISLNAPDAASYQEVTRPVFGDGSFEAMLRFAGQCKDFVPEVAFSVVDVISPRQISRCQAIADEMDIPLRVRQKS